jgi:hypothetical protein
METLLASAVADPDAPVSALTMLTEQEQRTLLGWTQAGAGDGDDPPTDAETAEALAGLDDLSDEELDALINRI